ncbi:MAG: inositol 2-dehydrogenase [Planctomycetaceae bacterium]|nr:inositol 2-dehydrogenase [Planctomycetaceae bacterium]
MSANFKIGLVGAGRIGKVHAKTFSTLVPDACVAGIADIDLAAAKSLANQYDIPVATDDYRRLLDDKSIDAIAVCTPTDFHADMIIGAAEAKKHVFCEKPLAFELDQIDAALAAVEKNKVVFMMGFNRRHDVGHSRIRKDVVAGRIGNPELCLIISRDPAPPSAEYIRTSGGIFVDMMIHDFDLSRYLLNDEPVEIYATGSCMVDPEFAKYDDFDTAMVVIRFAKGAICHIDNSRRAVYGYDQRVEVMGSKGRLTTANLLEDNTTFAGPDGFHEPRALNFFMERYVPAFQTEGIMFVDCVKNGTPPACTGFDGRAAVAMAKAAALSAKTGRAVKMEEIG